MAEETKSVYTDSTTHLFLDARNANYPEDVVPLKRDGDTTGQLLYDFSTYHYVYKLTNPPGEDSPGWETYKIYENGIYTTNTGVLLDAEGYPLFSWDLIEKYGIGFILSDWIIKDNTTGLYKIKFKRSYLEEWLDGKHNGSLSTDEEYTTDLIYSSKLLSIYGDIIPDLYNLIYVWANYTSEIDTEKLPKKLFCYYDSNATGNVNRIFLAEDRIRITGKTIEQLSKAKYYECMASRVYPGNTLKGIEEESTGNCKLVNVYPTKYEVSGKTNIEFIFYNKFRKLFGGYNADKLNGCKNTFIRCKINDIVEAKRKFYEKIDAGKQQTSPDYTDIEKYPTYWSLCRFKPHTDEDKEECIWFIKNVELPNNYKTYHDEAEYDFEEISNPNIFATNKKFKEDGILADISPYESGVYSKWQTTNYLNSLSEDETHNNDTTTPAAQTLEEAFSEENLKRYKTPSEYYSTLSTAEDENIEDAYGKEVASNRIWFWLDTIKNWCTYVKTAEDILYLQCWNGIDGWDRIETIVNNLGNPNTLAEQFLYTPDFFVPGTVYGTEFAPIRYPDGTIAEMNYNYIQLTRDTITNQNYNDKFQSRHISKINWCKERNEISNVGIAAGGTAHLANGDKIWVNEEIPGIQCVPTQYCPTIIKLMNGNVGICVTFLVQGNGFNQEKLIITADDANNKCRDIFGDGNGKTIEQDWKHYYTNDGVTENASTITTDLSTFITGAPNLIINQDTNKINSMTFFANRPLPITNDREDIDFVDRWKD